MKTPVRILLRLVVVAGTLCIAFLLTVRLPNRPVREGLRTNLTMDQVGLGASLVLIDTGSFPADLGTLFADDVEHDGWDGPYLVGNEDDIVDEWGRKLILEGSEANMTVISTGEDGERGTEDDLVRTVTREDALRLLRKNTQPEHPSHSR